MNVDSVRAYCLSFTQAKENLQWGDDICFKVGGKIFAVLSLESVPPGLCFKCTPEKFAELCEQEGIRPAPYVGRYKWLLLEKLDVLSDEELEDLVRQSYHLGWRKAKGELESESRKSSQKSKAITTKDRRENRGTSGGADLAVERRQLIAALLI
jgi:predicted DNA-binding protein (MmcQ/YjbR family)